MARLLAHMTDMANDVTDARHKHFNWFNLAQAGELALWGVGGSGDSGVMWHAGVGSTWEGRHHCQRAAWIVWWQRTFTWVLRWSAALPQRYVTKKESTTHPDAVVAESLFATSNKWKSICQPLLTSMLPCLYNHFLFSCFSSFHSDDGVSIPCSYTSFLAPLSSSKLYNEVRGCRERDKDPECHFETPYVVRLHNFHQLAEPKPCFTFKHPTKGRDKHTKLGVQHSKRVDRMFLNELITVFLLSDMNNNRYQCLKFTVGCNSVLHGFAGYFETTLYKDVTLSKSIYKEEVTLCYNWIYILMIMVCVCVCVCGRYKTRNAFTWNVLLVPHPLPPQSKLYMH